MSTSRILLVEDEDIIAGFIEHTLADQNFSVVRSASAAQAWTELERPGASFDAILLDRQLPDMNGMELLGRIKGTPSLHNIPVVMETGQNDVDSIREGLAAGAYYYLTKPLEPKLLLAVVDAAVTQHREFLDMQAAASEAGHTLDYLESGTFRCRTLAEARELAQGLARACPDPGRVVMGLQELLINAVEHGNLGISYAEKTHLVLEGIWEGEVERRLSQPDYSTRMAWVTLTREAGFLTLTIRDQGDGFDWSKYLEFDPERALDPHGRGIAMARMMSFDVLEYLGNGNTVKLKVAIPAPH